jgi:hypothetical protein
MPRKTLRERKNPSQTKKNRIRQNLNELIGIENPDLLMSRLMNVIDTVRSTPEVGKIYIFVYTPKTPNLRYDAHPLVAVSEVFSWGFRGINFHWGESRQYTWSEIGSSLHLIYKEELPDIRAIHFGKIKFNG